MIYYNFKLDLVEDGERKRVNIIEGDFFLRLREEEYFY